jgi:hypothetical protein
MGTREIEHVKFNFYFNIFVCKTQIYYSIFYDRRPSFLEEQVCSQLKFVFKFKTPQQYINVRAQKPLYSALTYLVGAKRKTFCLCTHFGSRSQNN